jgi:hypothetical protein
VYRRHNTDHNQDQEHFCHNVEGGDQLPAKKLPLSETLHGIMAQNHTPDESTSLHRLG